MKGPAPGERLGRFELVEELGSGAMGRVYTAIDGELGRKVAVKVLRQETIVGDAGIEARARILREARAMARLAHPNVVRVHELGDDEAQVYLVMELIEGQTVAQWLDERPRSIEDIVKVFVAAADGLGAAHGEGLVHRDFKPDNVLLDRAGRVRVTDFGLACVSGEAVAARPIDRLDMLGVALTRTGAMVGTPRYMSPEQFLARRVDARTDQFSFCVALYAALYREAPFDGVRYGELMDNVIEGRVREAAADAAVPAELRAVVVRGLASEPDQRWPSMSALAAALRAAIPQRRAGGRGRLIGAIVAAVVLVAAAGAGIVVAASRDGGAPAASAPAPAPCLECARIVDVAAPDAAISERALDLAAGPDGWSAWTERRGDAQVIVALSSAGSRRDIAGAELAPGQPAFAPTGQRLAFRGGRARGLYIASLDMFQPERVTDGDDTDPTWLDDDRIAFTRRDGDGRSFAMVVSLRSTSPPTRLIEQPRRVVDADPAGGALLLVGDDGRLRRWTADGTERELDAPDGWLTARYGRDGRGIVVATEREVWRIAPDRTHEMLHRSDLKLRDAVVLSDRRLLIASRR